MSKPMRCDECGEKAVVAKVLETYAEDLDHDGRKYHVKVRDLPVFECAACGEIEMDTDAAGRLYDALRDAVGIMPAAEIRRRRKELHLTQEAMASLLGVAVSTLSRWETGAQMQQRCMDNMLRAFFDVPALRAFLIRRSGRVDVVAVGGVSAVDPSRSHDSLDVQWSGDRSTG